MQETKSIYVLLMRSDTFFSRVIHIFTGSEYTHSSLGMSSDCQELYSFARKYTNLPLPGCFVRESVSAGVMAKFPKSPCALYEIKISDQIFETIRNEIEDIKSLDKPPKYSIMGTLCCWVGYETKQRKRFFCSRFVADILERSGAITLNKPAALFQPMDFTKQPELTLVYSGTLGELAKLGLAESELVMS